MGIATVTFVLMISPWLAVNINQTTNQVTNNEDDKKLIKETLNAVLIVAKSKFALNTDVIILHLLCVPIISAATNARLRIVDGILIAGRFG